MTTREDNRAPTLRDIAVKHGNEDLETLHSESGCAEETPDVARRGARSCQKRNGMSSAVSCVRDAANVVWGTGEWERTGPMKRASVLAMSAGFQASVACEAGAHRLAADIAREFGLSGCDRIAHALSCGSDEYALHAFSHTPRSAVAIFVDPDMASDLLLAACAAGDVTSARRVVTECAAISRTEESAEALASLGDAAVLVELVDGDARLCDPAEEDKERRRGGGGGGGRAETGKGRKRPGPGVGFPLRRAMSGWRELIVDPGTELVNAVAAIDGSSRIFAKACEIGGETGNRVASIVAKATKGINVHVASGLEAAASRCQTAGHLADTAAGTFASASRRVPESAWVLRTLASVATAFIKFHEAEEPDKGRCTCCEARGIAAFGADHSHYCDAQSFMSSALASGLNIIRSVAREAAASAAAAAAEETEEAEVSPKASLFSNPSVLRDELASAFVVDGNDGGGKQTGTTVSFPSEADVLAAKESLRGMEAIAKSICAAFCDYEIVKETLDTSGLCVVEISEAVASLVPVCRGKVGHAETKHRERPGRSVAAELSATNGADAVVAAKEPSCHRFGERGDSALAAPSQHPPASVGPAIRRSHSPEAAAAVHSETQDFHSTPPSPHPLSPFAVLSDECDACDNAEMDDGQKSLEKTRTECAAAGKLIVCGAVFGTTEKNNPACEIAEPVYMTDIVRSRLAERAPPVALEEDASPQRPLSLELSLPHPSSMSKLFVTSPDYAVDSVGSDGGGGSSSSSSSGSSSSEPKTRSPKRRRCTGGVLPLPIYDKSSAFGIENVQPSKRASSKAFPLQGRRRIKEEGERSSIASGNRRKELSAVQKNAELRSPSRIQIRSALRRAASSSSSSFMRKAISRLSSRISRSNSAEDDSADPASLLLLAAESGDTAVAAGMCSAFWDRTRRNPVESLRTADKAMDGGALKTARENALEPT